jgi:hypothetical protein
LHPKDTIVAPAEGSEQATAAASKAPNSDEDEEIEPFNAHLTDTYNRLDWSCLKNYQLPLVTYKYKKSWVYCRGYRVASRSCPSRIS